MSVFGCAFLLGVVGKERGLLFQLWCKRGGGGGVVWSDRRKERAAAGAVATATDPGSRL